MRDHQLRTVIENMRAANVLGLPTVEDMRQAIDAIGRAHPLEPGIACRPENAGGVRAEWLQAADAREDRVVVYLHGGGYVIGSIETHRGLAAK